MGGSAPGGGDHQRATTRILLGPFAVSLPGSLGVKSTDKPNSAKSTQPGPALAAGARGRRGQLGQVCDISHAAFHNSGWFREGDSRSLEVHCMYEQR